jgi:DNA-binding MarR family transcriptional regulator
MVVAGMGVAAGRIGLPDLDQGLPHGPAVLVHDAPGDDDALAAAIERLIAEIMRRGGSIGAEPSPLSTTQALMLRVLADHGPLRLGTLAVLMGTTSATASRTVDVLERAGFVRRVRDPLDGRGVTVEVTPAGRGEVRRRRKRMAAMVGELLKGLQPVEQRRFVELVDGLNELLVASDRTAAPV